MQQLTTHDLYAIIGQYEVEKRVLMSRIQELEKQLEEQEEEEDEHD